jgi:acetylornithine deacetylase
VAQELSGNQELGKVSFGTDAAHFQHARIPAVVCGPGSIEQAHTPNEYITVDQIALCEQFMRRLLDRISVEQ